MDNKVLFVIAGLVFLILFIGGCTPNKSVVDEKISTKITDDTNTLPDSFNFSLSADFTSSGGSRYFNARFVFMDSKLIYGWKKTERYEGSGNNYVGECVANISSLTWINVGNSTGCEGSEYLNKVDLQKNIDSGYFVLNGASCPHLKMCYRVFQN